MARPSAVRKDVRVGFLFLRVPVPSSYNKLHLSFEDQLALLIRRGLEVTDHELALDYLTRIGYYRLSAYWYSLRKLRFVTDPATGKQIAEREDNFVNGSTFQNVLDLYVFDKKLRLLLMDAIERVEVSLRVDVAYVLSTKDIFAQESPRWFDTKFTTPHALGQPSGHQIWLQKQKNLVNQSRETFVKHFREKYGLPLPIWVSIELWDFGMLSKFYEGMVVADKRAVAKNYGLPHLAGKREDWQLVQSWLRTINFTRNVVAHHSRLWNKNFADQPKLPLRGTSAEFAPVIGDPVAVARLYGVLCILSYFLMKICPQSSWRQRVVELVKDFPNVPGHSVADMGFPMGWESHSFWA